MDIAGREWVTARLAEGANVDQNTWKNRLQRKTCHHIATISEHLTPHAFQATCIVHILIENLVHFTLDFPLSWLNVFASLLLAFLRLFLLD